MIGSSACSDLFVKTISTRRLWMHFDYSDVGDFKMVTIFRSWGQNSDIGDIWMSAKMAKTVTNTFRLQHPDLQKCGITIWEFYEKYFMTHIESGWNISYRPLSGHHSGDLRWTRLEIPDQHLGVYLESAFLNRSIIFSRIRSDCVSSNDTVLNPDW